MVAFAALGLLPTTSRNSVPRPGIVFASRLDSAFLRIHSAALSPLRRFGQRAHGPASEGDGFQCETGERKSQCSVSTIRGTGSASNRERGAHTGLHSGPVPITGIAKDGQLRAVRCQHVGSEVRLGAKAG